MLEGRDMHLKTSYDLLQQIEIRLVQTRETFAAAEKAKFPNMGDLKEHIVAILLLLKRWEGEVEVSRRVLEDASARSKPSSSALMAK
jgi:hypothetical protein